MKHYTRLRTARERRYGVAELPIEPRLISGIYDVIRQCISLLEDAEHLHLVVDTDITGLLLARVDTFQAAVDPTYSFSHFTDMQNVIKNKITFFADLAAQQRQASGEPPLAHSPPHRLPHPMLEQPPPRQQPPARPLERLPSLSAARRPTGPAPPYFDKQRWVEEHLQGGAQSLPVCVGMGTFMLREGVQDTLRRQAQDWQYNSSSGLGIGGVQQQQQQDGPRSQISEIERQQI